MTFILLSIYSLTECSVCAGGPATITTNCCNQSYCRPCLLKASINALDGENKKLFEELIECGYEAYIALQAAIECSADIYSAIEWCDEIEDDPMKMMKHNLFCPVCWKPVNKQ